MERAYARLGIPVRAIPVEVPSGVLPQPSTLEETIRGALNRATNALRLVPEAEEGVGIESGLTKLPIMDVYVDVTVAVIVDRGGRASVGLSPAFQVPPTLAEFALRNGKDLSEAVREALGIADIGRREGLIGLLTRGAVVRRDLNEYAVTMALVPRLNPQHYPEKALNRVVI